MSEQNTQFIPQFSIKPAAEQHASISFTISVTGPLEEITEAGDRLGDAIMEVLTDYHDVEGMSYSVSSKDHLTFLNPGPRQVVLNGPAMAYGQSAAD